MLFGFVSLLACWLAGQTLVSLTGLPLPGNVAGMLMLLVICLVRRGVEPRLAQASSGLLSHMGLLFVPAGVGLIEQGPLLAREGGAMLGALAISVVITMAVAALTLKWLLSRKQGRLNE
ncbi:MAG: CidA/LrgA family protein [Formivibrio sp.]|nr:CidA/LrgA family protein [Formivibrio sp.]